MEYYLDSYPKGLIYRSGSARKFAIQLKTMQGKSPYPAISTPLCKFIPMLAIDLGKDSTLLVGALCLINAFGLAGTPFSIFSGGSSGVTKALRDDISNPLLQIGQVKNSWFDRSQW